MFTKRFFSGLGLLIFFAATFGNLGLWFYMNKTQEIPYVKQSINAGDVIRPDNIRFRSIRIQDLPDEITLSKADIESLKWRAVNGLSPSDPITRSKVTDQQALKIEPNQMILSLPFTNTGLLTFLEPGDRINIIDSTKTLSDVLVLGKYDKEGNKVSLLPALSNDVRKQAQGIIDQALPQQQPVQATAALLLLVTMEQTQEISHMSKPIVALQSRDVLMPAHHDQAQAQLQPQPQPQSVNQNGGGAK